MPGARPSREIAVAQVEACKKEHEAADHDGEEQDWSWTEDPNPFFPSRG
jgi:hypothetical protein